MKIKHSTILILFGFVIFFSCKKDPEFINPYDELTTSNDDDEITVNLNSTDFAYLHRQIFAPTCANAGCHDGSFFPDYRTISSSYNTMVYQPVTNNHPSQPRDYRVDPGSSANSMLVVRLEEFIPNTSGKMPLQVDPDSDWSQNKDTYIQNIKDWINQGAKDMFGNAPQVGNANPEVVGVQAFALGNTSAPFNRMAGAGMQPIAIPSSQIDLWLAVTDDVTSSNNITYNKIKVDSSLTNFANITEQALNIESGFSYTGFSGANVNYNRKISLDFSSYPTGTPLFLRIYLQDADHTDPVEIPNIGSSNIQILYFSLITV